MAEPRGALTRFVAAVERLNEIAALLGAAILLWIAAAVVYEVVQRYIFAAPTDWTFELTGYALVWCGFLAAGYTLAQGGHVRVEILADRLPPRPQVILAAITDLIALSFCLVALYYGVRYVQISYITESTSVSELRTPMWVPELSIPVGTFLLSLAFIARMLVRLGLAQPAGRAP